MNHSSRMLLIVLLYATACRLVTLYCPFAFDSEATGSAYGVSLAITSTLARANARYPRPDGRTTAAKYADRLLSQPSAAGPTSYRRRLSPVRDRRMANAVTNVDRHRDSHLRTVSSCSGSGLKSRGSYCGSAIRRDANDPVLWRPPGSRGNAVGSLRADFRERVPLVLQWTESVEGAAADRRVHSGCCERLACLHPRSRLLSALSRDT